MKKISLTSLICFVMSFVFGQNSNVNVTSYDIKAKCNLYDRTIDITANLEIDKAVNTNTIKLLLGSWTKITSIKSGDKLLDYNRKSADSDSVYISLSNDFNNGKKLNLTFDYSLLLDTLDSKNKNVVFLPRNSLWYPMQYDDIASMKLNVIAPNNYTVFATGELNIKKSVNNNFEYDFENKYNDRYALFIIKSDTFNTTLTLRIDSVNINFYGSFSF